MDISPVARYINRSGTPLHSFVHANEGPRKEGQTGNAAKMKLYEKRELDRESCTGVVYMRSYSDSSFGTQNKQSTREKQATMAECADGIRCCYRGPFFHPREAQ